MRVITDQLAGLLTGKRILGITFLDRSFRLSARLVALVVGKRVLSVKCKGKLIYIAMDGGHYLVNHLGMTGHWRLDQSPHSHLLITYEGYGVIYFDDMRRFGEFSILSSVAMQKRLAELGPDVMSAEFTPEVWRRIVAERGGARSIVDFLADQSVVSGVGNYLRADILYLAQIDPHVAASGINAEKINDLYAAIKTITTRSYEQHGTTIATYRDINMQPGFYKPLIYGKRKDSHGNSVETYKSAGRTISWVPAVQTYGRSSTN